MADISDKGTRRLPYPLLNPLSTSQDTPDEPIEFLTIDVFPTDPDEPIAIKLELSLNEYVALSNAVDIGRDIAFGEDTTLLWWLWAKVFKGLAMVDCGEVADCIETSDAVATQLAINNSKNSISSSGRTTIVNPATTTVEDDGGIGTAKLNSEVKELLNCNLNGLWAGIRDGIVQRLDDNARNFLETLVARADVAERAQELINLVPVVGTMAVAVIEQITELAPDMLNLYNSYSSLENLDNIACDIFGIVCADCRYPTYDELFSYYASAGITGIDDIANLVLTAATDYLTGSTELAALAFYHTMMAYQLFILYLNTKFAGGNGLASILQWASLGEDYANDNWQVLCDSCDGDYVLWTWDFRTQGQGEFYQDTVQASGQGIFEAGKGWRCVNFSTGRRFVVAFKFDPTWKIHAVAMLVDGDTGNSWSWTRRPIWGSTSGQQASSAGVPVLPAWTRAWEGYGGLIDGVNEVYFYTQWAGQANVAHLAKVSFLFSVGYAPSANGVPTNNITPYTSP